MVDYMTEDIKLRKNATYPRFQSGIYLPGYQKKDCYKWRIGALSPDSLAIPQYRSNRLLGSTGPPEEPNSLLSYGPATISSSIRVNIPVPLNPRAVMFPAHQLSTLATAAVQRPIPPGLGV